MFSSERGFYMYNRRNDKMEPYERFNHLFNTLPAYMWDDYWNNSNNFYLYIDLSGKFYFIPFDYDNTLGTSFLMNDAGKQDPDNWGSTSNPLISKIISIAEYKTYYDNCLRELVSPDKDLFYVTKSKNRIVQWQSMEHTIS